MTARSMRITGRFTVHGIDTESGMATTIHIDAAGAAEACHMANLRGVMDARPVPDDDGARILMEREVEIMCRARPQASTMLDGFGELISRAWWGFVYGASATIGVFVVGVPCCFIIYMLFGAAIGQAAR